MFKQYFCKVNQPAQNIFLSKEIGGKKKQIFLGDLYISPTTTTKIWEHHIIDMFIMCDYFKTKLKIKLISALIYLN